MVMFDKEARIKEERTIEATKKRLTGFSGKLACVATFLGSKIVSSTSDLYSSSYLEDEWAIVDDEPDYTKVHDADEDDDSRDLGYIFDGLSRGMHLEIKYLFDEKSITVLHKGIKVYREESGDLVCYAPTPEWEGMVNRLFVVAEKIAGEHKKVQKEEVRQEGERKKAGFLESLRLRWGI